MTKQFWVSTTLMTGFIEVSNDIIIDACPVWSKWVNQKFSNFLRMHKQYDLQLKEFKNE